MAISKIGRNATDTSISDSGDATAITISSAELVTVASGLTLTDGDITVASGHGISFAATGDGTTMTSELLDEYEEGTFTISTNSNLNIASDSNGGRYTKIGNRCHINFTCGVNSVSGTNHVFFTFPFTSLANTSGTKDSETVSLVAAYQIDLTSNAVQVYGKVEGGSPTCYVYMDFDDGANAILTNAALSSSSFISINHTFVTA